MTTAQAPVSDMLVTVKSREIQRALLAEARGDRLAASRHLLAAAHLELADDYERQAEHESLFRSRLSAASCLRRAGELERASQILEDLRVGYSERRSEIDQVLAELRQL